MTMLKQNRISLLQFIRRTAHGAYSSTLSVLQVTDCHILSAQLLRSRATREGRVHLPDPAAEKGTQVAAACAAQNERKKRRSPPGCVPGVGQPRRRRPLPRGKRSPPRGRPLSWGSRCRRREIL